MANDYGYIYLILNNINGKTYIGKRKLYNKKWNEDEYMGSGTRLHMAQKKYGIENFEKFFICYTTSEEDACEKEVFWINEYRNRGKAEYNLAEGGQGGGHISAWKDKTFEEFWGEEKALEYKKKLSDKKKGKPSWNKGKTLSDEHKRKLSESHKGNVPGNKGKRGRFWYTNGTEDKIFYPNEVPEGWKKGRCKVKGRVQSIEERKKRSLAYSRAKHPEHFKLTEEQKQNLSWAKKRYYGSIK